MLERATAGFAEAIFRQIALANTVSPSHAASFAILVYISRWLKNMSRLASWRRCSIPALGFTALATGAGCSSATAWKCCRWMSHSGWDCTLGA